MPRLKKSKDEDGEYVPKGAATITKSETLPNSTKRSKTPQSRQALQVSGRQLRSLAQARNKTLKSRRTKQTKGHTRDTHNLGQNAASTKASQSINPTRNHSAKQRVSDRVLKLKLRSEALATLPQNVPSDVVSHHDPRNCRINGLMRI